MTDITFEVVCRFDEGEPTQQDIDRAARFMAISLYRTAGPRHTFFHEGKRLRFDASDSAKWTGTIPAEWEDPPEPICGFTWVDDDGETNICGMPAGHPWEDTMEAMPHSAKGISREQARTLVREAVSSTKYVELVAAVDAEFQEPPAKKAAKPKKTAKKKAGKGVVAKASAK